MLVILYGPVLVDSLYLISYTVMIPLGAVGGLHEILISVNVAVLVCIRSDITPASVLKSC